MFFCIVGVTVTVASEAERTYHVAVSRSCMHIQNHAIADLRRLSVSSALDWSSPRRLSILSSTHP
jgi:hypothetical protein